MTEAQLRQKVVDQAMTWLGIKESDGSHRPLIDLYNTLDPLPVGYPMKYSDSWCAAYISVVALQVGLTDIILPECSCPRMTNDYKAIGRYNADRYYTPQIGDVVMLETNGNYSDGTDHVGFVIGVSSGSIQTIEGNCGDSCCLMTRYPSEIHGYCLPDYASKADYTINDSVVYDPEYTWRFLLGKIGNPYGVAALMGNLQAESGLYSHRLQGDFSSGYQTSVTYTAQVDSGAISKSEFVNNGPNGGGYGLAQWTFWSRKQALYEKYKSGGYGSIGSLRLALDYLWIELQNSYPGVLSVLKSATSVRQASDKVLHDFENPADQSTSVEVTRASMGQVWYDKFINLGPVNPGGGYYPWVPPKKRKSLPVWLIAAAARRS